MYHALILIGASATPNLENYHQALVGFYAEDPSTAPEITLSEDTIKLEFASGFFLKVELNAEDYVLEEAQELADDAGEDHESYKAIASAPARYEISSAHDENMDYFNDYLYVLEQADASVEDISQIFPYDSASNEFLV